VPAIVAPSLAITAVGLIINFVARRPGGFMNSGPVIWVGQLSYSLYLWQQVFCWQSPLTLFGRFPLNLAASVTMACASFYLIERPALRLRSRSGGPLGSAFLGLSDYCTEVPPVAVHRE
jgi:peptidoglycan/LPS O-acetylase OafA/YrhL